MKALSYKMVLIYAIQINHSNLDFSVIFHAPKKYRSRIKIMSFPICIHENTGTILEPDEEKLIKQQIRQTTNDNRI